MSILDDLSPSNVLLLKKISMVFFLQAFFAFVVPSDAMKINAAGGLRRFSSPGNVLGEDECMCVCVCCNVTWGKCAMCT